VSIPVEETRATTTERAISLGYARYVLGILTLVYVVNFIDRQILAMLLEPIKQDLGKNMLYHSFDFAKPDLVHPGHVSPRDARSPASNRLFRDDRTQSLLAHLALQQGPQGQELQLNYFLLADLYNRLGDSEREHEYAHEDRGFAGDCCYATQRHFVDRMLDRKPFETSGEEYLQTLAVQEAVYESAATGVPVAPRRVGR